MKLQDGAFEGYVKVSDPIETQWLHERYVEHAKELGERYPLSNAQFGKALRGLCPPMDRKRKKNSSREWQYHFPSLEECRRAFEQKVGQPIPWD